MRILCLGLLFVLAACSQSPTATPADAVYLNGAFYVGNSDDAWQSEVAVADGKFIYVGDDASNHVGPETIVHNLDGHLVIPGLIDAHAHTSFVAQTVDQVLLEDAETLDDLLATIRDVVEANPDRDLILGGFWQNHLFGPDGPHKSLLDAIEPNRPVILYDDWAHTVWANSKALEMAGVTRDTQDVVPDLAFYQKDEDGEPTGWITESAASVFINKFQVVDDEISATMLELFNYYRTLGVSAILDAGNFGVDREVYAAVSKMDNDGVLPIRFHGSYTLFLPDEVDVAVDRLKALAQEFDSENVRIDTLKIFFDGVIETRTAALSHDYYDTPGNSGDELFTQEQLHGLILELDDEGLNLHVHAVGDRATTTVLDAVEAAHKTLGRPAGIRIAICHLELVKETDFARFKELGVIAQFTPHWASGGDLSWNEAGIGDAVYKMQRSNTFVESGAIVTFSSDITSAYEWRTDRANPYLGMQVGHNRQDIDGDADAEVLPPIDERIARTDLVNGYSSNAAYQLGRESDFGSIAVGLSADLVILNQNLFEVDRYAIHKTEPVAVVFGGNLVHGELPKAP